MLKLSMAIIFRLKKIDEYGAFFLLSLVNEQHSYFPIRQKLQLMLLLYLLCKETSYEKKKLFTTVFFAVVERHFCLRKI